MQEREETQRTRSIVRHTDSARFVINLHALHNHKPIRDAVPYHLRKFPKFFPDRMALHREAAASLRNTSFQKKLAREARARKQAEDARQALPLAAGELALELLSMEQTDELNGVSTVDAVDDDMYEAIVVEPHGPRGRRRTGRGRGRSNGRGRSSGRGRGTRAGGGHQGHVANSSSNLRTADAGWHEDKEGPPQAGVAISDQDMSSGHILVGEETSNPPQPGSDPMGSRKRTRMAEDSLATDGEPRIDRR